MDASVEISATKSIYAANRLEFYLFSELIISQENILSVVLDAGSKNMRESGRLPPNRYCFNVHLQMGARTSLQP